MTNRDPVPLDQLIASVADGRTIDWDALTEQAGPEAQQALKHLRLLSSVADVHRSAVEDPDETRSVKEFTPHGGETTRWGHLELIEKIGEGAFGEVFRARDSWLDREVALKLLKPDIAQHTSPNRILSEARTLARLRHPNVVSVYGADVQTGRVGLWMELIRGQTLSQILSAYGTFSAQEATVVGQEVCRALAAVHAAGIVHKDLKAQNVMRESGGRFVLMDFGAGGTPVYLAPEVLAGSEATVASDIYAVGVLLFHLVTRRYPAAGASLEDLRKAHARGERRRLVDERTDLPDEFVELVEQALHPDAQHRFSTAGEMLEALGGRSARLRTTREHDDRSPQARRSIAVLPFVEINPEKHLDYFCEGISEEIISALTGVPGVRVVARTSAFRFLSAIEDVRQVGTALGVGWVLEGSVRSAGDRLRVIARLVDTADGSQRWSQRFDCLLDDVFAVQEQIATAAARALGVRAGGTVIPHAGEQPTLDAYTLYLRARHCWNQRTEATLQRSVKYFVEALKHDPGYGEALAGLAEAYTTLGLYGVLPPHDIMPKAKAAAEDAIAVAPALSSPHATAACVAAVYDWHWDRAEAQFQQAFGLNPRDPAAHHWCAINYLVPLGRFDVARRELALAAEADPLSMPIRLSTGLTSYFAHEFERARRELEESLELDPGASTAYLFLGLTLAELGEYDDGLREIETAQRLSPSPEMIAAAGLVAARSGRHDRAREALAELAAHSSHRYISPSLSAQVHAALGDTELALDALERALAAHAADLAWLRVRPVFDTLRGEARFARLIDAIGVNR